MWTYNDAKPIADYLNAKIVGSVKTKGKSRHDLDLLVSEYTQGLSDLLRGIGYTYMGSQVVSPPEIKRSRKFGGRTDVWLRNRRFEDLTNRKVIELWTVDRS